MSAMGQTRSPRAAPRNASGASGNPQIRDSLVAAPKRVGHVPIAAQRKFFCFSSEHLSPAAHSYHAHIAPPSASRPRSRPPSRSPNLHSRRCSVGCPFARDFVPGRFSDACCRCSWLPSSCRRQRNLHNSDRRDIGNPITPECPLLEQHRQDARGLGSSVVSRNLEQSPSSLRQTGIA